MLAASLRAFSGLPRRFWVLWVAYLLNRLGGFVVPFLALYLDARRGVGADVIGTLIAAFGAGSVIAGPLGGHLADRIGRRATTVGGYVASAGALALLASVQGNAGLFVATFVLGLAMDAPRPALNAMVADLVPEADRTRAYAALYWAANLGFASASVIAGFVAQAAFDVLFLVDAATCLTCAAILLFALPETRPEAPVRAERAGAPLSILVPFRDRSFVPFFALSLALALVFFQFHVAMPLDMKAHGLSTNAYGVLVALNGILVVLLSPVAAAWVLRLRRGVALAIASALTAVGFGLFGLGGSIPLYALGITVFTLGEVVMAPVSPAVVAELAPDHLRGTYQGAYHLSISGALCFAPIIGGYLLAHDAARVLWALSFVLGAITAGLFLLLPLRRPEEAIAEPSS